MSSPGAPPRRAKRSDDRYGRRGQQPAHRQDGYTSSLFEEFSRLHVEVDRDFQETLDKRIAEQERLHLQALDQAKAEHERVRQGAERARELLELEIEKERARRELDETRQLEAERKARLDRETAELTRQRQELERQEQEQRKRTAEEQAIQAARTRLEEEQRRQREEDERRQREQAEAHAKAQSEAEAEAEAKKRAAENAAKAQPPPAQSAVASNTSDAPPATSHTHPPAVAPPGPAPVNGISPSKQSTTANPLLDPAKRQQREEIHAQSLALHKRLKVMRRDVFAQKDNFPDLKKNLGDWKRKIKSCFAQVTTDRLGHAQPVRNIALQVTIETTLTFGHAVEGYTGSTEHSLAVLRAKRRCLLANHLYSDRWIANVHVWTGGLSAQHGCQGCNIVLCWCAVGGAGACQPNSNLSIDNIRQIPVRQQDLSH